MDFAVNERFRQVRKATGLSQEKFGFPIGMTRDEVKNVELDKTELREDKLVLFCREYGKRIAWMKTGELPEDTPRSLGDELGDIAAQAAQNNVDAVRKFFRELGNEFTDAEILFLYEIYKKHFGKG